MTRQPKPRIAITLGDPGGVGPEVVCKALLSLQHADFEPVIVGPATVLNQLGELGNAMSQHQALMSAWIDVATGDLTLGNTSYHNAKAAVTALELATEMALTNKVDALVTGPIHKSCFSLLALPHTGHTTYLKAKTHTPSVRMAFTSPKLRVMLTTIHHPLSTVHQLLTPTVLTETFEKALEFATWLGIPIPRIAVAGLNPHAGEEGRFGREEIEILSPAISAFNHPSITGPYSADSLFLRAYQGEFDMVIAMYHDQGLIPLKLLAFDEAVNVTVGLPFVRTSPDHGTALDIAYQDKANPRSMLEAIRLAAQLCRTS
jgi:4-hydroxythreonine-4-phosphate dehydrogenase